MSNELPSRFSDTIKQNAGLTIIIGIIVMLMGLFAMGAPLIAGLSIALMVGCMLVLGGLGQLVYAIKAGRGAFAIIVGVLTVIIGAYMLMNLGSALASLTIFLAVYLIFSGVCETIMGFQARPHDGWAMACLSGVISIILGVMIWNQFPLSGAWAIGILLGVRLFFNGLTLLLLGVAVRGAVKDLPKVDRPQENES